MMRPMFLILAMLVVALSPARSEDRPLTRPSRDVAIEYRSSGMEQGQGTGQSHDVTMRFASKTGRIRIDGPGGRGYAILDIDAGRMTMVIEERRMYIEQPADPGMTAMFQAPNTAFTKTGTDTVAGLACTMYDAKISDHRGEVCLTVDGVLLRARGEDPNRQHQLEALKVTYGDQADALFEPPAGFQKLDPSAMRRSMESRPSGVTGR